jgi:hypothetical protein
MRPRRNRYKDGMQSAAGKPSSEYRGGGGAPRGSKRDRRRCVPRPRASYRPHRRTRSDAAGASNLIRMIFALLIGLRPMGRLPHRGHLGFLFFFEASLLLSQVRLLLRMLRWTFVFLLRLFGGCHRFLRTRSRQKDNASDNAGVQHPRANSIYGGRSFMWPLVEHRSCI